MKTTIYRVCNLNTRLPVSFLLHSCLDIFTLFFLSSDIYFLFCSTLQTNEYFIICVLFFATKVLLLLDHWIKTKIDELALIQRICFHWRLGNESNVFIYSFQLKPQWLQSYVHVNSTIIITELNENENDLGISIQFQLIKLKILFPLNESDDFLNFEFDLCAETNGIHFQ